MEALNNDVFVVAKFLWTNTISWMESDQRFYKAQLPLE